MWLTVTIIEMLHFYEMCFRNYLTSFVYNEHFLILEDNNKDENMRDFKKVPNLSQCSPNPLGFSIHLTVSLCSFGADFQVS